MTLKDVAAIAGKPGLYNILKPARSGVIVETIGAQKKKTIVNASERISILKEISIYVIGQEEESVALEEVFASIKENKGEKIDLDVNDNEALKGFMKEVLPSYDQDRVYNSDIKKLVNWYNLLSEYHPEVFEEEKEEDKEAE